jgi:hypothetical protein
MSLGYETNLKEVWEIAETASDPRIKLEARRIVNDCYKYIRELTTDSTIITDAMKYVIQKTEQGNTLRKLDEKIEGIAKEEEEETTTNGIF